MIAMAKSSVFDEAPFQNDEAARAMLESILWPNGPVCPHCGVVGHAYTTKRPGAYRCGEKWCRKDFTVTMRTVMERSKIALHKWLLAFHLMTSSKKGVSAHQLHKTLHITYEAAWFMAHRIRESMRAGGLSPLGGGSTVADADEPHIGGRKGQPVRLGGATDGNTALALVERGSRAQGSEIGSTTLAQVACRAPERQPLSPPDD